MQHLSRDFNSRQQREKKKKKKKLKLSNKFHFSSATLTSIFLWVFQQCLKLRKGHWKRHLECFRSLCGFKAEARVDVKQQQQQQQQQRVLSVRQGSEAQKAKGTLHSLTALTTGQKHCCFRGEFAVWNISKATATDSRIVDIQVFTSAGRLKLSFKYIKLFQEN